MNGLIITSTEQTDLKLFIELAQRLKLTVKPLTDEELLDLGLLKAMEEGRTGKFVPKARIMKKLLGNESKVS